MKPIEVNEISRRFGDVKAVSKVSFTIQKGEIFGLIGPDGAGKTTLLRMILGAIKPDSGNALIGGIEVETSPDRARELVGYMPQAYGLYGDLTVRENMHFFADLHGVSDKILSEKISELLHFVRLDGFSNRRADALSGGMYKKLAIACSIVHSPEVLILDEPTNGVDPVSRRELWSLLFRLAKEGVAILISTPYMDEAERCNTTGLMFEGRLVHTGKPGELIQSISHKIFEGQADNIHKSLGIIKNNSKFPEIQSAYVMGKRIHILLYENYAREIDRKFFSRLKEAGIKRSRSGYKISIEDVFMNVQANQFGATK